MERKREKKRIEERERKKDIEVDRERRWIKCIELKERLEKR